MGIRSIFSRVGSIFSKKPKQRPLPAPVMGSAFRYGHRGTAAGNLDKPDLSEENKKKWRLLNESDARGFMEGEPTTFHSTNVFMAQYFPADEKMMVEFRNGKAYLYKTVTEDMAWRFLHAVSKGGAVWDIFRVRGSKTRHRVPYERIK